MARKIELEKYHGVKVGAYSYGPALTPEAFPSGVTVGRYVSIAAGVKIFVRNHPVRHFSLHPFFYNSILGYIKDDPIKFGILNIGHDSWIGHSAMITPGCTNIGIGAIVRAGSIVTKNVPDFAIVAGNPGKILRYRFDSDTINDILESGWWNLNINDIVSHMGYMILPLSEVLRHPLLCNRRVV